jgi:hypothetical protein
MGVEHHLIQRSISPREDATDGFLVSQARDAVGADGLVVGDGKGGVADVVMFHSSSEDILRIILLQVLLGGLVPCEQVILYHEGFLYLSELYLRKTCTSSKHLKNKYRRINKDEKWGV